MIFAEAYTTMSSAYCIIFVYFGTIFSMSIMYNVYNSVLGKDL